MIWKMIFKDIFSCRSNVINDYQSFELQLFTLDLNFPLLVALIYHPPKHNRNFLNEFADFWGEFTQKYEKLLILGDFYVHLCCTGDQMYLEQHVNVPTHQLGHTLDLVLTYGFTLYDLEVLDNGFSDHKSVMFSVPWVSNTPKVTKLTLQSRLITSTTSKAFSLDFCDAIKSVNVSQCDLSAEELLFRLNSTYMDVLDTVAPVKSSKIKPRYEPWINDNIRPLRQICRRAVHKWKGDRLQISFEILRDPLFKFQKAVRAVKSKYFTAIVDNNYHRPKTLCTIFNAVVSPTVCEYPDASKTMCDDFLQFFINKISDIRLGIFPPAFDPSVFFVCSVDFSQLEPISFLHLQAIVFQLKPSGSSIDFIPPYIVTMINQCF